MAKKASKKAEEAPLKLFYIFYNQERWDNWVKSLGEARFEIDPKSDEMPEGFRVLDSFSVDITLEVLKIVKLYQNKRFTSEETQDRLAQVEAIVMSAAPKGDLEEIIEILQLPKLVLFASCRKYLTGGFDKDIKTLVKKGRDAIDKDMEQALEIASNIGASVIDGRARFRHAKKIERLAGYRVPEFAFSPVMLETITTRFNFDALDFAIREQLLSFFDDFLRCKCRNSPLCGCPEKKFAKKVI